MLLVEWSVTVTPDEVVAVPALPVVSAFITANLSLIAADVIM